MLGLKSIQVSHRNDHGERSVTLIFEDGRFSRRNLGDGDALKFMFGSGDAQINISDLVGRSDPFALCGLCEGAGVLEGIGGRKVECSCVRTCDGDRRPRTD